MTQKEKEKKINAFKKLGMTPAEIEKALADDEIIDKGKRADYEPSVEEEKAQRKATKLKVDRAKRSTTKREKTLDTDKVLVIDLLKKALEGTCENIQVPKAEGQIDFVLNGNEYSVKLTKHRVPKE